MKTPPSLALDEISSWAALALRWLDSHTPQILSGALAAALIILLLHGLKLAGHYLCADRFKSSHWPGIIGRALGKTRLWFMSAIAVEVVAKAGKAPEEIAAPIYALFVIACVLQAAVWVRALILGLVEFRAGENDSTGNLHSAIGLIRVLVTAGLFILAAIVILSNLGVNVTGLVAGLGIGGMFPAC
jgi:small-conductance mechanosensitive channel